MAWWRSSILSQIACPTRWFEIANAVRPVIRKDLPAIFAIFLGFRCGFDVKVVAPTGEFEPVKTHPFRQRSEVFQGEIGPLAGK